MEGRFHVEELLGIGTVGSVYRARDRTEGLKVALKIWNTNAHDDQTSGRFMREARALSTLRHPNIVDIQSYGMVGARPYVAMEYLDGKSLEAMLTNAEPLETRVAFDLMTQILAALTYAHELGVVHRDLKPDNVAVVLDARGRRVVKVLDYGLAKFLSANDDPMQGSALTMTGMIMGTPLYMAPEQAAGKPVDARVDVYAAGCMLFEMLSGRPPFTGENNWELFRAHMEGTIPKLTHFGRDRLGIPGLQEFLEKALAKRPEDRFSHAGQMLDALAALRPSTLRAPSPLPLPRVPAALAGGGRGPSARIANQAAPDPAAPADDEPHGRLDGPASSRRTPLLAALVTFVCTVAALAYALLR